MQITAHENAKTARKQHNSKAMAAKDIEQHKFKKGQTGNPNGRPKKIPEIDVLLGEVLNEPGEQGMTIAKQIIDRLAKEAIKGNTRAAEVLLDRAYGKVKSNIELSGPDGGPIQSTFTGFNFLPDPDDKPAK